jgi:outer membrane receptor protein involved in Fe transport
VFDLSFSRRQETDISGFGANFGSANIAYSAAVNKKNKTDTYTYKWTYTGDSFVNEANATYLDAVYNPSSLNPDDSSFEYQGVITYGGKDSTQRISQQSYVLRDDLTYNGLENHVIKGGVRFAFQDYDFTKNFFVQPRYFFQTDATKGLDFSFPATAQIGVGNPRIIASNSQLGAYIQDDWDVTDKLQINAGLRWDYESNLFNNRYRTPAAAIATLNALPKTIISTLPTTSPTAATGRPGKTCSSRGSASAMISTTTSAPCCSAGTANITIATSSTTRSTSSFACNTRPASSTSRATASRVTATRRWCGTTAI